MALARGFGAESRREALLGLLGRDGNIRLERAAEQLGVSAMTVRRDLDEMDAEGVLRRVRGGAIPSLDARPFGQRRATGLAAKTLIAAKAATLLPSRGAIAIDASTTAGLLAPQIGSHGSHGSHDSLVVVTNSYENFLALTQNRFAAPVLTGGEIDRRTGSFVGPVACRAASSVLYSRFFASANTLDAASGSSEVSLAESQVKHAFAERSNEVVLLVDSSKLDQRSLAVGFALADVTLLVTELDPSDAALERYRDQVELL